MPFIPVANTLEVVCLYRQYEELTSNVLHVRSLTAWSPEKIATLAGIFADWFAASWADWLPNTTVITGLRITDLTTNTVPSEEITYGVPIPGAQTAGEPGNVTYSIAKTVQARYRGGHGRLYVPGIANNVHTGNYMNTDAATGLQASLEELVTMITGEDTLDATLVVIRKTYVNGVPVTANAVEQTGWHLTDLALDSQRRRLPGRGR